MRPSSVMRVLPIVLGLALGWVCYATASGQAAQECFRATVPAAVLPAVVCTILAWILYLTRKPNSAIVVSAIPIMQVTVWCVWTLAGSFGLAR